jgi:hypothetical protein
MWGRRSDESTLEPGAVMQPDLAVREGASAAHVGCSSSRVLSC